MMMKTMIIMTTINLTITATIWMTINMGQTARQTSP
jgi:hypothetical protein